MTMNPLRLFCLATLLLGSAACLSLPAHAQADDTSGVPMNILVLYADDWRHDTLGAAGNAVVETPTIDGLAERASASRTTA